MSNNSRRSLWLLLLVTGCSTLGTLQPSGVPVRTAYDGGKSETVRIVDAHSPLSGRQPVPVLTPPEVFAVYAPSRLDRKRDVLVGEHWIFLKLKDGEWFTERVEAREPVVQGPASDAEFEPLRRLGWDQVARGE